MHQRRGTSLNQTVIELLTQSLGVHGPRSNGLGELAGALVLSYDAHFEQIARVGSVTLSR